MTIASVQRHSEASASTAPSRGGHPWWATLLLTCAAAISFAVIFPEIDWWWLTPLPPALLALAAMGARGTWRLIALTAAPQYLMWLWLQQWVAHVTTLGHPAMCVVLTVYPVLFVLLARRVLRSPRFERWPAAVLIALAWTALEVLRGEVAFNGYPWYLLAHPLIDLPGLPQSADLFGAYFVSFIIALIGGVLAEWGLRSRGTTARRFAMTMVCIGLVIASTLYGLWRASEDPSTPGPRVLAIQTNLPQDNKTGWTLERQVEDLASFIVQTRSAYNEAIEAGPIDLIIWPETMLPGRGLESETLAALAESRYVLESFSIRADFYAAGLLELHAQLETPILVGSPAYTGFRIEEGFGAWDAHYNAAYLIAGPPPYQRYDKMFLTPFGETMPYISAWPWLEQRLLGLGARGMSFTLDAGESTKPFILPWRGGEVRFATPICFEDTMARTVRRLVHGAEDGQPIDLIVNLSNDGWFAGHNAGRSQHLQIARYRAIEHRRFMLRVVNTGRTVAIDPTGKITAEVGAGRHAMQTPGWLAVETRLDPRSTLYGRIGDLFGFVCLILTLLLGLFAGRARPAGDTT